MPTPNAPEREIVLPRKPRAEVDEHNLQGGRLLYSHAQLEAYARTAILEDRRAALKAVDSDEGPIWAAIIGWLEAEGSDESVAAVNAAILADREAGARAAQPAEPQWISVDERLPWERVAPYIVATIAKKAYPTDSNYSGMGIRGVAQDWVVRNYASNYTHWMELPAHNISSAPAGEGETR